MERIRGNEQWIAIGVIIVVLALSRQLPWFVTALALGGGGGYLLWLGWGLWTRSGGPPSRSRVTYWRGQRIEVGPQRRGPALPRWRDIGPALLPLILGGVLLLGAISMLMRYLGA